jgi:tetratricopeptide (TPR) repeat protein
MKKALAAAALVAGFLLAAPAAHAQTGTARGKVVDSQGQPIADAKVLVEFQGGVTRKFEVKTNKKGEFMQVGMQPGVYKFTVSKEGYQGSTADQKINLGDPTEVPEFKLHTTAEAAKQGASGAIAEQLKGDFQKAVDLHSAGKLDEAEAAYKAILGTHPDVPEVYRNLGAIYLKKKSYPEAETALLKANELRPNAEVTQLLVQVYQESGQQEKAMALLDKSADANPTDVKAQYNRGILLLNANKNEEALAAFQAAIKADPSFAEPYYRLSTLLLNQGKVPEAIQSLEKYLSLNPTDTTNVATAQGLLKALKK